MSTTETITKAQVTEWATQAKDLHGNAAFRRNWWAAEWVTLTGTLAGLDGSEAAKYLNADQLAATRTNIEASIAEARGNVLAAHGEIDAELAVYEAERAARAAALAARGLEDCEKCGGVGGHIAWPGYTCWDCDGRGTQRINPDN